MNITRYIVPILILIAFSALAQDKTPTPQWRPAYHFTPKTNWTNDPNGLIFLNGEFHLYYQHNPLENKLGHMSWGHATSKDLINWKYLPVAIPEMVSKDTTVYIYSGSAVLDKNNTSGFGKNGKAPVVAIFTADLPKQHNESQYVAYSNNNGLSFSQYQGNPVIDLGKSDFRDPNVFWHEPSKQWVMTVAMVNEHAVRFYGSPDLKHWSVLSDFGPAGYHKKGWECPSLLPLAIEGEHGKTKWVLFVSSGGDHGPLMQYYIGSFDGKKFTNDNPADTILTVDNGDAFYAAIAWRDAPEGEKILLGWMQNGRRETYPWKGQMSIPRDLSLKRTPEGLRLIQKPASVVVNTLLKNALRPPVDRQNIKLDGNILLKPGNFKWIEAEVQLNESKDVGFLIAASEGGSQNVRVGYNVLKQELYVDCSASEKENKAPGNLIQVAPLKPVNGRVKFQVLIDGSSLEVFGNDGEKVISTMIYPDKNATGISLFSNGKSIVSKLSMWDLNK